MSRSFVPTRPQATYRAALLAFCVMGFASAARAQPPEAAPADAAQQEQFRQRDQLWSEAQKLESEGKLAEAIAAGEKMLAIERQLYTGPAEEQALSLDWLGWAELARENFAQAENRFREALDVQTKVFGGEHWKATDARLSLESAQHLARLSSQDRQDLDDATELEDKVAQLDNEGKYTEAVEPAEKCCSIRLRILGERRTGYISSLMDLAEVYAFCGEFARSEPLYCRALELTRQVDGERHPDYAEALRALATLRRVAGDVVGAEPLYRQALRVLQQTVGDKDLDYAHCLSDLSLLCRDTGDFSQAERCCRQALEIRKEVLGEEDVNYAQNLNNLAVILSDMGLYAQSEPLQREATEILRKLYGEVSDEYANSLQNLADLYRSMGKLAQAKPLAQRALEIREKVLGASHPDVAVDLNNLALIYADLGETQRAEELLSRSLEIIARRLGEKHPYYAVSLSSAAVLHDQKGDSVRAEPLYRRALAITLRSLEQTASIQSQRQQLAMASKARGLLDSYLDFCMRTGRGGDALYPFWLAWKGQVTRRERQLHALAERPELKPQFDELDRTTAQLAQLSLSTAAPDQADAARARLAELSLRKEQLERDLSAKSAKFRAAFRPPETSELQAAVPAEATLIDFAEYLARVPETAAAEPGQPARTQWIHVPRLAAFVVKRSGKVQLVDLQSAGEIAAAVDAWREGFGVSVEAQKAGQLLRQRVWQPLAAQLAGAGLVLVSPDGALGRFPLAALPGEKPGAYLIEEQSIAVIATPAALMELNHEGNEKRPAGNLLVLGDVDYNLAAAPAKNRFKDFAARGPARGKDEQPWPALSGTQGELAAVADIYREAFGPEGMATLRKSAATEEALRQQAPHYMYLHLATHSFFAAERFHSALAQDVSGRQLAEGTFASQQNVAAYHPGLLSGLVLAGANHPLPGHDDGYLTAEEVMALDLRGARLCVLSACETGLGQVAGGEGLLGLQRAFEVAGAKTVVASLWQVPDQATRALMERFYRNLWERDQPLEKLAALREAQLWMLREGTKRGLTLDDEQPADAQKRLPPYYWAAFVLSGDWR